MPDIRLHPTFPEKLRKFVKHNNKRLQAVKKVFRLFQANPQHPSLHLEKLAGGKIWSVRIDQANRLFFTWSTNGDTAIFFFVGPHDTYRNF